MRRFLVFLTLLLAVPLITSTLSFSTKSIIPIKSFKEVDFEEISKETFVVFDVDETLIQPVDTYLINEHTPQGRLFLQNLPVRYPTITTEEWLHIASIMLREAPRPLIEPEIVNEIKKLLNRGNTVIACTGMNTGSYGSCSSLEEWRYEHLKSLGFKASFDDLILYIQGEKNPVFYKGILCTDCEWKGSIIGAFLDKVDFHPKQIIMFDDTLDELLSVQEECKRRGIKFKGYHYQGAHKKEWDEPLIESQADYLIHNKKWISDEEARKLLRNSLD